jgi:Domain of unknown function (DUF1707)
MGEPEVRLSDAERDAAVARLRESCAVGRLTLEEFSGRADAVYAARTRAELEPVLADLPAVPAPSRKHPRRFVLGLFGGLRRLRGNDERGEEGEIHHCAPLVRVVALTVFGGVDVYHVPRRATRASAGRRRQHDGN